MPNKDKMLKGLSELEKILKDVKSGKSKPKPPIDVTTKKGMDKAIREISGMEMGGEVMDMTKSQPVSMMDEGGQAISDADRTKVKKELQKFERSLKNQTNEGGNTISDADLRRMEAMMAKAKPKKMNMGGVVPGRGGSFKGVK